MCSLIKPYFFVELAVEEDSLKMYYKFCQSCKTPYVSAEVLVLVRGEMPGYIIECTLARYSIKDGKAVSEDDRRYVSLCRGCLDHYGFVKGQLSTIGIISAVDYKVCDCEICSPINSFNKDWIL